MKEKEQSRSVGDRIGIFLDRHPMMGRLASNAVALILGLGSRLSTSFRKDVAAVAYKDAFTNGNRVPDIEKVYRFLTPTQQEQIEASMERALNDLRAGIK